MSVVFAADGRTFYVANAARGDYGMLAGKGAITRCEVSGEGKVSITHPQFTPDLSAPVSVAILMSATPFAPAGSLVAAVGGSWTTDARGRSIEEGKPRGTGLVFIDATSGAVLGRLFLGKGSGIEAVAGHAVMDPISVAADSAGNLYVADYAARGTLVDTPGESAPGIYRLTPAAVNALAQDGEPPAGSVGFLPVRSLPTAIIYSNTENALYWVTGLDYFDLGGALLRLPGGDFGGTVQIETVAKDLTSMTGVALTRQGTAIVSRNNGDIAIVRGRKGRAVRFRHVEQFLSPGQLATTTLDDGSVFVVVPEATGGGSRPWQHRLRTFVLPASL